MSLLRARGGGWRGVRQRPRGGVPRRLSGISGHTLVVPRRHCSGLFDLNADEYAAVWRLAREVRDSLYERLTPMASTWVRMTARRPGRPCPHAHVHVIPRFDGDVPDPRGGVRWVIPGRAAYWEGADP